VEAGGLDEAVPAQLPGISPEQQMLGDYASTGLSLKAHPLSFLRSRLDDRSAIACTSLRDPGETPAGRSVHVAGLVLVRQRPATASGVVFITLEDETGIANLVVWPKVYERFRSIVRLSCMLLTHGRVERQGEVVHVHADLFESLDTWVPELNVRSRDFH
jgi:error-prone DNA polymerase